MNQTTKNIFQEHSIKGRTVMSIYFFYACSGRLVCKWEYRNTCVSTGNSSSSEAKPRWKDGRGFNSAQGPLLIPLNRLLNFWSDQMNSRSRLELERLPALSEATCIRYIGHRLMIPYTGEGMGKVRVDK